MQPLDVTVFNTLKRKLDELIEKNTNPFISVVKLTKNEFAKCLLEVIREFPSSNVIRGFEKCGLFPWGFQNVDLSRLLDRSTERNVNPPAPNVPADPQTHYFRAMLNNVVGEQNVIKGAEKSLDAGIGNSFFTLICQKALHGRKLTSQYGVISSLFPIQATADPEPTINPDPELSEESDDEILLDYPGLDGLDPLNFDLEESCDSGFSYESKVTIEDKVIQSENRQTATTVSYVERVEMAWNDNGNDETSDIENVSQSAATPSFILSKPSHISFLKRKLQIKADKEEQTLVGMQKRRAKVLLSIENLNSQLIESPTSATVPLPTLANISSPIIESPASTTVPSPTLANISSPIIESPMFSSIPSPSLVNISSHLVSSPTIVKPKQSRRPKLSEEEKKVVESEKILARTAKKELQMQEKEMKKQMKKKDQELKQREKLRIRHLKTQGKLQASLAKLDVKLAKKTMKKRI